MSLCPSSYCMLVFNSLKDFLNLVRKKYTAFIKADGKQTDLKSWEASTSV